MEILPLKCNNCGADLKIPKQINYFNCSFCDTSLQIKESGNVFYTEALSAIKKDTNEILNQTRILNIEKEIERLDREWVIERESLIIHGEPEDTTKDIIVAIFAAIFILSLIVISLSNGAPLFLTFFYFGMIAFLTYNMLKRIKGKTKHKNSKKQYQFQKNQLLGELELLKQKP